MHDVENRFSWYWYHGGADGDQRGPGGGDVTVLNRSRVKTQPVADAGAKVADTPGDAVKGADYICSILDAVPLSVRFSSKAARMRK